MRTRSPRGIKNYPSEGFRKNSEFRGVVAARSSTYKSRMAGVKRYMTTEDLNNVIGRHGSNSPASRLSGACDLHL